MMGIIRRASTPRPWDVARRAAPGPASLALFWAFVEWWPNAANAWGGVPGEAAFVLMLGAYLGSGVRAGAALNAGPRVAGALGVTHLAVGLVAFLSPILGSPAGDPYANWIGRMLLTFLALAGLVGVPLVALVAFFFVPGRRPTLPWRAAASFLAGASGAGAVVAMTYVVAASIDTGTGIGTPSGPVSSHDDALRIARVAVAMLSALGAFVIGTMGVAGALEDRD